MIRTLMKTIRYIIVLTFVLNFKAFAEYKPITKKEFLDTNLKILENCITSYICSDCNLKIGCDIIIQQLNPSEYKFDYIQR